MKKSIGFLISIIIISIVTIIIYSNLPIEITRKSEIQIGNSIIENIENYKLKHKKLPENEDWKTLKQLGFKIEISGSKPYYQSNPNGIYELIFIEGFDGPYLKWNSKEKIWKIDF